MIFGRSFWRLVIRFFARPILPFGLDFLVLAPLVLGLDETGIGPFYLAFSPLIVLTLGVVNLPLTAQVFRLFSMDSATKRNHALEHATIHFLLRNKARVSGGRAEGTGFRVSGGAKPADIRKAFTEVERLITNRQRIPHISRHCGSNLVTSLALALLLLAVVTALCLFLHPSLAVRAALLAGVPIAFILIRHTVGNSIQARFFMATDFVGATIRSIRDVPLDPVMERGPVRFVETLVTLPDAQ